MPSSSSALLSVPGSCKNYALKNVKRYVLPLSENCCARVSRLAKIAPLPRVRALLRDALLSLHDALLCASQSACDASERVYVHASGYDASADAYDGVRVCEAFCARVYGGDGGD